MIIAHRRIGMGILALTLIALGSLVPARAAEVSPYLPNDSQIVWSMNVKQILDSELVKKYAMEHIKNALKENGEVQRIMEQLGFDPLKDVTAVTGASMSIENAKDKSVLVIQGRFDLAKFEAKAAEAAKEAKDNLKIHTVGSHKVYEVIPKDNKDNFFVGLIDSSNLVAAPTKEFVVDAFDKKAGKKKAELKKELSDLLAKVDSRKSLSVAALGAALGKVPANDESTKAALEKLKNVSGGITISDDVKLEFVFNSKDADGAKEMNKVVNGGIAQAKGIVGLFAAQQPALAPVMDVLNTFKVKLKENETVLTGEVNKELIEKALKNVNNK
jgi:hypothetical protein